MNPRYRTAMRWLGLLVYGLGIIGVATVVGDDSLQVLSRMAAVMGAFGAFLGGALWGFNSR